MSYTAAVITVSDKGYAGQREDTSGPNLVKMLTAEGFQVLYTALVPDDKAMVKDCLIKYCDASPVDLILTTGGTGFSPRDLTPEATLEVITRRAAGIPEAMRAASMKITPNGCLSRSEAGIRNRTLIVNLPGSEKAAQENLEAVLPAISHGLKMLRSEGSADCASPASEAPEVDTSAPSLDAWMAEAKADAYASYCGMYLFHRGVVRGTAKAQVRENIPSAPVKGMDFNFDEEKVQEAIERAKSYPGIYFMKIWLRRGRLNVGEDIMQVLVGGDIRSNVLPALEKLVADLKNSCVEEVEIQ